MSRLFAVESVSKSFGARQILKAASVWGREGRITALFGRNGCGKSTMLRIGVGLMAAEQGTVHFAGRVYLRPRLSRLAAAGLFYLPDAGLLSKRLTLRQQIRMAEWHFGTGRTAEILERLELGDRLDQRSIELSGGERRRAELALAWIRDPRCLLADEPFAGIDPADQELLGGLFREMARDGCALVITGHDVAQLLAIADDVVWMTAGTTHGLGAPAAAAAHDQFRREYLGPTAGDLQHRPRRAH